jgi:hypothetical protein
VADEDASPGRARVGTEGCVRSPVPLTGEPTEPMAATATPPRAMLVNTAAAVVFTGRPVRR